MDLQTLPRVPGDQAQRGVGPFLGGVGVRFEARRRCSGALTALPRRADPRAATAAGNRSASTSPTTCCCAPPQAFMAAGASTVTSSRSPVAFSAVGVVSCSGAGILLVAGPLVRDGGGPRPIVCRDRGTRPMDAPTVEGIRITGAGRAELSGQLKSASGGGACVRGGQPRRRG
ncbi:hypothetical protein [Streptacidiphilus sp. EB103A]|uniref:hypothetical protein n=1 Tax=Streptacidiphilus sp. EB103A TaxID=3156275 RepID=UPI0035136BF2